jgi:hypothetical protein
MARKERAEVFIFPREPARASPRRKIRPRERRGSQAGEERTLGAFGQSQEREGDKHRDGQAPQQEQRYQTRALATLEPGRLFLAHIKHALRKRFRSLFEIQRRTFPELDIVRRKLEEGPWTFSSDCTG